MIELALESLLCLVIGAGLVLLVAFMIGPCIISSWLSQKKEGL